MENGGTLGMVPLIINPIYTLYSGYELGISSPFKELLGGLMNIPTIGPSKWRCFFLANLLVNLAFWSQVANRRCDRDLC